MFDKKNLSPGTIRVRANIVLTARLPFAILSS